MRAPEGVPATWSRGVPACQGAQRLLQHPPVPATPRQRRVRALAPHCPMPSSPTAAGPGALPEPRAVARASRTPSAGGMAAAPSPEHRAGPEQILAPGPGARRGRGSPRGGAARGASACRCLERDGSVTSRTHSAAKFRSESGFGAYRAVDSCLHVQL